MQFDPIRYKFDEISYPSKHFSSREETEIKYIVLHCVGGHSIQWPLEVFDSCEVSAHYLIPQETAATVASTLNLDVNLGFGSVAPVIKLVEPTMRAYHAGKSIWQDSHLIINPEGKESCKLGLSSASIGIELHAPNYGNNDGSDWYKFTPFSDLQIKTLISLLHKLMAEFKIKPENVIGHSDIAPYREGDDGIEIGKTDPGPLFPWKELQKYGIGRAFGNFDGVLPSQSNTLKWLQTSLSSIGYSSCPITDNENLDVTRLDDKTKYVVSAFRMHFMHDLWDNSTKYSVDESLLRRLYYMVAIRE